MNPNQNLYQNFCQGVTNYTSQGFPQDQNQFPMDLQGQPSDSNMAQPPSSGVQIAAGGNQFLYGVQPVVQRQSLDSSGGSSDFMAGLGNSNLSAGSNVSGYSASSGSNQDAQNASTGSGYNPDSNTAGVNQSSSSGGTRVSQMSKYSDSPISSAAASDRSISPQQSPLRKTISSTTSALFTDSGSISIPFAYTSSGLSEEPTSPGFRYSSNSNAGGARPPAAFRFANGESSPSKATTGRFPGGNQLNMSRNRFCSSHNSSMNGSGNFSNPIQQASPIAILIPVNRSWANPNTTVFSDLSETSSGSYPGAVSKISIGQPLMSSSPQRRIGVAQLGPLDSQAGVSSWLRKSVAPKFYQQMQVQSMERRPSQ